MDKAGIISNTQVKILISGFFFGLVIEISTCSTSGHVNSADNGKPWFTSAEWQHNKTEIHPFDFSIRQNTIDIVFFNRQYQAPKAGGFHSHGLTIEVGGKGKSTAQVREAADYLIAADGIEIGSGKKVPLWLFGYLY